MSTEARVLEALVEGGKVIRKTDKTGRTWYSLASPNEQLTVAGPAPRAKRARESAIPSGWTVGPELRQWARGQGCDDALIDAYAAYFTDWAISNSKTYTDWDAAFRNCVRGDWGGVRKNHKPGTVASAMKGVVGW